MKKIINKGALSFLSRSEAIFNRGRFAMKIDLYKISSLIYQNGLLYKTASLSHNKVESERFAHLLLSY